MKTSISIGKFLGFPIKLHITLLIIVAIIAVSVGANVFEIAKAIGVDPINVSPGLQSYLVGLVLAVGLFVSVFFHEIAHSIVARNMGVSIKEITLWLFGGVSNMEEIPREPNLEIKISIVGPLTSLIIGVGLYFVGIIIPLGVLTFIFKYLGLINLILAGFNLIPAFPMDGGRILRAAFARSESYVSATNKAASIGKSIAIVLGVLGFFVNPFLIIIAFFVYIGASQESQGVESEEILQKVVVGDIMSEDVKTVFPDMDLREFLDYILDVQHNGFPVVEDGEIIGIITMEDTKKVEMGKIDEYKVKDVMERDIICFSPEDKVNDVWKKMNEKGIGRFPILSDGELVGIVTRTDVMRSLDVLIEIEKFDESRI